jgi:hypothetical protein
MGAGAAVGRRADIIPVSRLLVENQTIRDPN